MAPKSKKTKAVAKGDSVKVELDGQVRQATVVGHPSPHGGVEVKAVGYGSTRIVDLSQLTTD